MSIEDDILRLMAHIIIKVLTGEDCSSVEFEFYSSNNHSSKHLGHLRYIFKNLIVTYPGIKGLLIPEI